MAFQDFRFPEEISYGSRGGPGFNTSILPSAGGSEERVARWSQGRHRYDVGYGIRDDRKLDDIHDIKTFYMQRFGSLHSFRYKDWADYTTAKNGRDAATIDDTVVHTTTAAEDGTTTFTLKKQYFLAGDPLNVYNRTITKPVSGTVLLKTSDTTAVPGGTMTEGTHFSVNYATGLVTLDGTNYPGGMTNGTVFTGGFDYDVHCRFDEEADDWFSASIGSFEAGQQPSIPLIEVVSEVPAPLVYGGGYKKFTSGVDFSIAFSDGRYIEIDATSSGVDVNVPDPAGLPLGGPIISIQNISSSNTFNVRAHDNTTIFSGLPVNKMLLLYLGQDSSSNYFWAAARSG